MFGDRGRGLGCLDRVGGLGGAMFEGLGSWEVRSLSS